jgi:hypothetical protein
MIDPTVAADPETHPAEYLAPIAAIAHAQISLHGIMQFRFDRCRAALLDRPSLTGVLAQNPSSI